DDDSTGSPFSTTVDQDAPSPSKSLTPTEIQSSIILQDTYKEALTQACWIEAMQEELNEFERLEEEGIDFEDSFAPVARLELFGFF
nr:Gag-Pol polyprotein [Tanacetum cinerariifolium]